MGAAPEAGQNQGRVTMQSGRLKRRRQGVQDRGRKPELQSPVLARKQAERRNEASIVLANQRRRARLSRARGFRP